MSKIQNHLKDIDISKLIGMVLRDAKKTIRNLENGDKIGIRVYYKGTKNARDFFLKTYSTNQINLLVNLDNKIVINAR